MRPERFHNMTNPQLIFQRGFTLVEAVIVIVITGILAVVAASFISRPIEQYRDLSRRAELTESANSAIRRMSRDLHLALPNSVRQANTTNCIEFLMSKDGGRYRSDEPGNIMQFDSTSGSLFDVIGPLSSVPQKDDFIVVYNLGIPGANAYDPSYRGIVDAGSTASTIRLSSPIQNPIESPAKRFFVLSGSSPAVTFVCQGAGTDPNGNGTGRLYRLSNYAITPALATCPVLAPGTTEPLLAENIASCSFNYASGVTERSAVLSIRLGLIRAGESVNLYQDVNISNVP